MKKAVISVGTKIDFATLLPVIPGKPLFCLLHAPTHTHTHTCMQTELAYFLCSLFCKAPISLLFSWFTILGIIAHVAIESFKDSLDWDVVHTFLSAPQEL